MNMLRLFICITLLQLQKTLERSWKWASWSWLQPSFASFSKCKWQKYKKGGWFYQNQIYLLKTICPCRFQLTQPPWKSPINNSQNFLLNKLDHNRYFVKCDTCFILLYCTGYLKIFLLSMLFKDYHQNKIFL